MVRHRAHFRSLLCVQNHHWAFGDFDLKRLADLVELSTKTSQSFAERYDIPVFPYFAVTTFKKSPSIVPHLCFASGFSQFCTQYGYMLQTWPFLSGVPDIGENCSQESNPEDNHRALFVHLLSLLGDAGGWEITKLRPRKESSKDEWVICSQ